MSVPLTSVHILGSREFGGADQFYVRLVGALHAAGQPVLAVNRPGSPVARALAGTGVEQVHVPLANRWDIWSVWRIRRLLEARAPCIVQTYMGRATRLTRPPAGRCVHIARLGGFYKIDGYYRHANAWVGNTRAICDYMIKEGLPARRVFHIGNFVPDARAYDPVQSLALREGLGIGADAWVLFGLGRLIAKKGFQDLLAALALLPREIAGRPWVMLVAGDGDDAAGLRAQSEALGLVDRVRWLGWQDPPDPWLDLADVVVVPSRHEPLGNVILEAWNYRRPVVSTDSDGARELIRDGETGAMTPCADPAALARSLVGMLEMSDTQRRAMGEAGHRDLQARFGKRAILDAYLELYGRLAREHSIGG